MSGEGLGARPDGPRAGGILPDGPLREALLRSAADHAVAEAEAQICEAWSAELERARQAADEGLAMAEAACAAARVQVRTEEAAGRLRAMTRAMRDLEGAEAARRRGVAASETLHEAIAKERSALAEAAVVRARTALENRERIEAAWHALARSEPGLRQLVRRTDDSDKGGSLPPGESPDDAADE